MKIRLFGTALISVMAGTMLASAVFAQNAAGDHPRIEQVDKRLENQQDRVDQGINKGQINAQQEKRDMNRDARISRELSKDEAEHNGHITKREERQLNRQLNKNSKDIHRQRHHKKEAVSGETTTGGTTGR